MKAHSISILSFRRMIARVAFVIASLLPMTSSAYGIGFGALNINIVVVPEPSTALLLGAGLTGLAIRRRSGEDARRSGAAERAAVGSECSPALP